MNAKMLATLLATLVVCLVALNAEGVKGCFFRPQQPEKTTTTTTTTTGRPNNAYCEKCLDWYNSPGERDRTWLDTVNREIPCPCNTTPGFWSLTPIDQPANAWKADLACMRYGMPSCRKYHPGADGCLRSVMTTATGARQQCCYSSTGTLLGPDHSGAGTPDKSTGLFEHPKLDVEPYKWCCLDCDVTSYCNYYKELRKGSNAHCMK
jgi:hypothetical protein